MADVFILFVDAEYMPQAYCWHISRLMRESEVGVHYMYLVTEQVNGHFTYDLLCRKSNIKGYREPIIVPAPVTPKPKVPEKKRKRPTEHKEDRSKSKPKAAHPQPQPKPQAQNLPPVTTPAPAPDPTPIPTATTTTTEPRRQSLHEAKELLVKQFNITMKEGLEKINATLADLNHERDECRREIEAYKQAREDLVALHGRLRTVEGWIYLLTSC